VALFSPFSLFYILSWDFKGNIVNRGYPLTKRATPPPCLLKGLLSTKIIGTPTLLSGERESLKIQIIFQNEKRQ
jgi:hypothetical protein